MSESIILTLSKAEISELISWAQSHYDASVMSTFGANLESQLLRYFTELSKKREDDSI